MKKPIPVRATMCATCPFRPGSKYASFADYLTQSALNESNRICHSTGSSAIHHRTGKPRMICRGARNVQLQVFHALRVIEEPTDEAWDNKQAELKAKRVRNK